MRTIPAGFLDATVTDLQVCWKVVRRDGVEILGTECDIRTSRSPTGDYAGLYLARAGITGSDMRSTSDLQRRQPRGRRARSPTTPAATVAAVAARSRCSI